MENAQNSVVLPKAVFCCGDFQGTYLADINLSGNGKRPPGRRRSFRSKEKVKMLEGTMKHKKDVNHVLRFILYNKFFRYMSTNSYNNIKKF